MDNLPAQKPATLLATALEAATAAAGIHLAYEDKRIVDTAREKGRGDFVTEVDLEAQRAALAVIRSNHATHRVLAEEGDDLSEEDAGDPNDPHLWIVDPLDGTANYLHNHPAYATSVGVAYRNEVVAGAVICAATGERWWARQGGGAWKDRPGREKRPLHVSTETDLRYALVGTGFPFKTIDRLPEYLGQFERVLRSASGLRRGGSAALDLCYLAQGSLDCFWEMYLSPWDVAAGLLILQEAGGLATRMDGSPINVTEGASFLAANSEGMIEALGGVVDPASSR